MPRKCTVLHLAHTIGQFTTPCPSDDTVRIACSGEVVQTVCQDHSVQCTLHAVSEQYTWNLQSLSKLHLSPPCHPTTQDQDSDTWNLQSLSKLHLSPPCHPTTQNQDSDTGWSNRSQYSSLAGNHQKLVAPTSDPCLTLSLYTKPRLWPGVTLKSLHSTMKTPTTD